MPLVFPRCAYKKGHLEGCGRHKKTERSARGESWRMDVKQILIIALFIVPVWMCKMNRCYDESELSEAAARKLRVHYHQPPDPSPAADPDSLSSCPLELYQHLAPQDETKRSLSPWRYVLRTMKDHFPSTYSEAQCLCLGCILIQDSPEPGKGRVPVENFSYNSVPIIQSRVFLKRELCSDGKKYHLTPVSQEVAVGCTCVRPMNSS